MMDVNATEELFDTLMQQMGTGELNESEESSDDENQSKVLISSGGEGDLHSPKVVEAQDVLNLVDENSKTNTSEINTPLESHDNVSQGNVNPCDNVPINNVTTDNSSKWNNNDSSIISTKNSSGLTFECKGCKSKFYLLRFYYQHMQRKTTEVVYDCEECGDQITFPNTCMLKLHMKEHEKKAETLIPSKLKAKLPQIDEFKKNYLLEFSEEAMEKYGVTEQDLENNNRPKCCPECLAQVNCLHTHLMEKSNSDAPYITCSDCGFMLPSDCSLRIHRRIHTKSKPFLCPECGVKFITWSGLEKHLLCVCYHYYRSVRSKCLNCGVILPGDTSILRIHLMTNHNQLIYKCCFCKTFYSQFKEINSHLSSCHGVSHMNNAPSDCLFHKCQLCPGSLIPRKHYSQHISNHINDSQCLIYGYKCRMCDFVTMNKSQFTNHLEKCDKTSDSTLNKPKKLSSPGKRVFKADDALLETAASKKMSIEPSPMVADNECTSTNATGAEERPVCRTCLRHFSPTRKNQNFCPLHDTVPFRCLLCGSLLKRGSITFHFSDYHKIQCSDYSKYVSLGREMKVKVPPNKTLCKSVKVKHPLQCSTCDYIAPSKESFRSHVVVHRSNGSYQCLECGECFVTRSSLEIHLISAHAIGNTDNYIESNNVHSVQTEENSRILKENQCSVCLEEFSDPKSLHLHFRSHGMAFLKQNMSKKVS